MVFKSPRYRTPEFRNCGDDCELRAAIHDRSPNLVGEIGKAATELGKLLQEDRAWKNETTGIERANEVLRRHQLDDIDHDFEHETQLTALKLYRCAYRQTYSSCREVEVSINSEYL